MPRTSPTRAPASRVRRKLPAGFVSVATAADRLGIHVQTARAMVARGELAGVTLAQRLLIAEHSITALLAAAEGAQ